MNLKSNNKSPLLSANSTTWIIISVSFLLIVFAVWAAFLSNSRFDQKIFDCIAPHISDSCTRLMLFITWGGNTYFLIAANILLFVYFIIKKNKWLAIRVAAISLSGVGVMGLIKNLVHRHRPSDPMVANVTNFSFPSGHAFMSVAFYGLLIWLAASSLKNKWQKRVAIAFLVLLILTIGFTRIYLRMHYPTDVIAGFGISAIWLITVLAIVDKIQVRYMAKRK
jgi:membrane-associated phospholipid phosphatase